MKKVGVSALAAYADDPVGYCDRKGKTISHAASSYGDRAHSMAGRGRYSVRALLFKILVIGAIAGWVWSGF